MSRGLAGLDRRAVMGGLAASTAALTAKSQPLLGLRPALAGAAVEVNVRTLGADPMGNADSTDAFHAAAKAIESAGGGRLIIPPGRYRVGRQSFAGGRGKGHAFASEDVVSIAHCQAPVEIEADGVTMFLTEGLRFGAFDPETGQAFQTPKLPFTQGDYTASLPTFFSLSDNADVRITGMLSLDGAIERQTIGGQWGDTGWQIPAYGVRAYNNRAFSLKGLRSRGQGVDDLLIGWQGLKDGAPPYPHVIEDVQGLGAGRNGLSWVGGNSLRLTDARFEKAGGRDGGPVASSPGAGIDIEAESAVCRSGVFQRVVCADNLGVAIVADSGDSADCRFSDCQFVGSVNWSAWPRKPRYRFERCQFVGPMVNLYGAADPADALAFIDCEHTLDVARSPAGAVYPHVSDFTSGKGALWQGGSVDLAAMSSFNSAGGPGGTRWKDTKISGAGASCYARGVFEGEVAIDFPDGVWDPGGQAVIEGVVRVNARRGASGPVASAVIQGPATR